MIEYNGKRLGFKTGADICLSIWGLMGLFEGSKMSYMKNEL